MAVEWTVTIDCAHPGRLAEFWRAALGYVDSPPPEGFDSWAEWFTRLGVPEDEWDEGASLSDPEGVGPRISLLKVPEPKTVKNRLHLDLQVGGGRAQPWEERWARVTDVVERLTTAGAGVVSVEPQDGQPDHVVMTDPEGNEFCVV